MCERSSPVLTAAQTASRLGVTVKALRVFERHGLVKPGRTAAGWRVYGPIELARLHQVLVLRRLGLPLAGIARLLRGLSHELDHTLALQEEVLAGQLSSARRALNHVRSARQRIARGELLSVGELIDLMQETTMTERQPTP